MDKLPPHSVDLFGEYSVSANDVVYWLETVPKIPRDSPRASYYIKNWDVINKIRFAKKNGTFPHLAANDEYFSQNIPLPREMLLAKSRLSQHLGIIPAFPHKKRP